MPYAHVRDIRLYYEEHPGEGPALLVAHGLLANVALARHFGERFDEWAARGLRVIAYDARGHGRSGYTTRREDYHWASLAEDMRGFIDALGLAPVSIYGGSMGAGTALMLALEHPEYVDKLILRAPPPFGERAREAKRLFGGLAATYWLLGSSLTARLLMRFPQVQQAQAQNPDLDLRRFFASQRRESVVAAIRGVLYGPPLPRERFGEIAHPALILTHPDDPIHPTESGELLYERMPHARLAVAPTAAYWQEHADALAHVLAAFVRGETIAQGLPEKVLHQH